MRSASAVVSGNVVGNVAVLPVLDECVDVDAAQQHLAAGGVDDPPTTDRIWGGVQWQQTHIDGRSGRHGRERDRRAGTERRRDAGDETDARIGRRNDRSRDRRVQLLCDPPECMRKCTPRRRCLPNGRGLSRRSIRGTDTGDNPASGSGGTVRRSPRTRPRSGGRSAFHRRVAAPPRRARGRHHDRGSSASTAMLARNACSSPSLSSCANPTTSPSFTATTVVTPGAVRIRMARAGSSGSDGQFSATQSAKTPSRCSGSSRRISTFPTLASSTTQECRGRARRSRPRADLAADVFEA